MTGFARKGWALLDDPDVLPWVEAVRPVAVALAQDARNRAAWLRHGETWFAGVNILPNDAQGAVPGGPALSGKGHEFSAKIHGTPVAWDRAQISIVYPGYPRQDPGETDGNHRFRRNRDAAHVDGLLPVGPTRRRKMHEPHAFVLGIPLNSVDPGASPMVVWEGSHEIMRQAFKAALARVPEAKWEEADLTEVYQAARRRCFEECPRVPVAAGPGQTYVIHRLALHGVAPWQEGANAPPEGRMIAYFRPAFAGRPNWLDAP